MPKAIICSATWGHLTRCCQFDDGTRQLAEITYKDALEKHGCLNLEDLIPPFFQNAGRGTERIWGETHPSPQPMVINWPGLNDKEKTELIPTLSSTDNWILLTYPLGAKNKSQPPLVESQMIARADGKCSRHKGWWREGKDELASHSTTTDSGCGPVQEAGSQRRPA